MIVACYVISATRYHGLASGRGNKLFIAAVVGLGSSLPVMRLVREVCYKCSRLSIYIYIVFCEEAHGCENEYQTDLKNEL